MGRIKPKGKAGAAKAYITRTAAVKKLQCSLADFRRLCILKGIYPREPRSRKKANKGNSAPTSFYYSKDIAYLQHEPVLRKLREHKAFAKKLSRALGRGEWTTAKGLEERKPVYKLDHIVKERYPTFIDAVRDIDDALCMIALFANLPTNERIPPSLIENCTRLYNEWQLYIMNTRGLKKVFLSIKGVYYQAIVQGETITWVVPWQFTQSIPSDVDVRVMLTFLELYQTLLGFVFFKLYTDEGWAYPPPLDASKDEKGAGVGALNLVSKGAKGNKSADTEGDNSDPAPKVSGKAVREAIKEISNSTATQSTKKADATMDVDQSVQDEEDEQFVAQPSKSDPSITTSLPTFQSITNATSASGRTSKLFEGLNFYLSRETPKGLLEFVIRSFGGRVGWDTTVGSGSPYGEDWEGITHVIIDRPLVAGQAPYSSAISTDFSNLSEEEIAKRRRRKYIQPQWVVDCVNAEKILSEDRYERGKVLPPHLSPFGEDKGAYQPPMETDQNADGTAKDVGMRGTGDDEDSDESESEEEIIEGEELPDEEEEVSDASDTLQQTKQASSKAKSKKKDKAIKKAQNNLKSADAEAIRNAELEAEAAGLDYTEFEKVMKKAVKLSDQNKADKEVGAAPKDAEKEMNKMMMSNKQRKLYEKMKYSERKREAEKATLEQKRVAIQDAKKKEVKRRARESHA